jgi:hypothetical protein
VAEDTRGRLDCDLAVDQVQVGAADAAGVNPQQQLALTGRWNISLDGSKGPADLLEDHRAHWRQPKNSSAV